MLYCPDCKNHFEEDELYCEKEYETLDGRTYVTGEYTYCPYCGSDDYEEAKECECCGEWIGESAMHVDFDNICSNCVHEAIKDIQKMIEAHGNDAMLNVFNQMAEVF